jgi:hypothetical protein
MDLKKKLVIEIEMSSDASEASIEDHMGYFINTLLCYVKDQATKSWNTTINTDWDKSYNVSISVNQEGERK